LQYGCRTGTSTWFGAFHTTAAAGPQANGPFDGFLDILKAGMITSFAGHQ
jgi:hypothetical protein